MKKMIDLVAPSGTGKDEILLNYIRKNYLAKNHITNLCFISGQGPDWKHHTQINADELRKNVFEKNSKDTIYFFKSFFFDKDRKAYLKLVEEMCNDDIQIFKTDQKKEHVTSDKNWTNRYVDFITMEDLND